MLLQVLCGKRIHLTFNTLPGIIPIKLNIEDPDGHRERIRRIKSSSPSKSQQTEDPGAPEIHLLSFALPPTAQNPQIANP